MTPREPQRGHLFSFYLPGLNAADASVELVGEEFHHLARVLRLGVGERLMLVDGQGLAAIAVVDKMGKSSARATILEFSPRMVPPHRIVLGLPLIARAAFEDAIAHCVEAGVSEIIPIQTAQCRNLSWSKATHDRARRVAVAAMKQCGRAWLPPVTGAVSIEALARSASAFAKFVVADPEGLHAPAMAVADTLAVVGPEAGLTPDELGLLESAGAERVSLSRNRLRAETAALVLVARLAGPEGPGRPTV